MSPFPITLDALQALDAIDRRGSFAKAAEELGEATSALSYTVQKLEEQLGVTLFQRLGLESTTEREPFFRPWAHSWRSSPAWKLIFVNACLAAAGRHWKLTASIY
jgi:DNA-binding transcriptional LysR family regulator